ncbi:MULTISPECIES: HAD hydrolase family protein [unclassified Clostridium]|jgi:hydroxymethylpyrimidine pyrophosphatase-like HAD family hydrolase|uniref:HAD hydrolase family protein n=1 Tax=unclassified Clostridium TaxID=2614128 RepID=UPI001106375F|nr:MULTISPECIES: HAD hydrolase family protein [unclassified Clostridium]
MGKLIFIDVDGTLGTGSSIRDLHFNIPMLEYCKIGVAMNNGGEEIRQAADYVTDDVEKDGLYKAFVYLGLMEE